MSRPNSSAPSTYLAPGVARFSIRLCRAGSSGASHGASAALTAIPTRSSLATDAGIEQPVGEVDEEIDDDEGEREDEHGALQQDVVAREDGLHHQAAEPRPGEDRLSQHGAAHELAGLQAEQGEDRDGGVAQGVLAEHPRLAHALGA